MASAVVDLHGNRVPRLKRMARVTQRSRAAHPLSPRSLGLRTSAQHARVVLRALSVPDEVLAGDAHRLILDQQKASRPPCLQQWRLGHCRCPWRLDPCRTKRASWTFRPAEDRRTDLMSRPTSMSSRVWQWLLGILLRVLSNLPQIVVPRAASLSLVVYWAKVCVLVMAVWFVSPLPLLA